MRNLTRRFGATTALDGVSLEIARGEFFALLGPSGCGKTTLLRILAGLEEPDAGEVRIAGTDQRGVPPERRPVNTVFQCYALFPHLSVRENVGFGLRMRGIPAAERTARVEAALALVQAGALGERRPAQISGGQRQRVALARALVNEPRVLLLDEPLGALDLQLRRELQRELRALQQRLGITFVHVTHDQEEALALSDRVAVMRAGRIEQIGAPAEIYARPRNAFVAEFLGGCNVLTGDADGTGHVTTSAGVVELRDGAGDARGNCRVAIRPEWIECRADLPIRARVMEATFSGADVELALLVGETSLRARCRADAPAPTPGRDTGIRLHGVIIEA